MEEKRQEIINLLNKIEGDYNVKILYAAESGSRAWGFASEKNSDWDVRGIYLRPFDWYLSLDVENRKDTIDITEGDIDIHLWDLRKALGLMKKSNPALYEWFRSPTIYKFTKQAENIRQYLPEFYSPRRCAYHYRGMALNNFKKYLQGSIVKAKKYLYVIRPILVLHWIERHRNDSIIPPLRIPELLLDSRRVNLPIFQKIWALIDQKKKGDELGEVEQDWPLYDWLKNELWYLESLPDKLPDSDADPEVLNILFRELVMENFNG